MALALARSTVQVRTDMSYFVRQHPVTKLWEVRKGNEHRSLFLIAYERKQDAETYRQALDGLK